MRVSFQKCWLAVSFVAGSLTASALPSSTFNLEHDHVPGELIVKFKGENKASSRSILKALGAKSTKTFRSSGAELLHFSAVKNTSSLLEKAKQLAALPNVDYVEANTVFRINVMPNDARFADTYGMHNDGTLEGSVEDADIDAPEAWEITTGSRDVLVGVIDTGIDYTHPDIAQNYWTNPGESGLDADGNDKSTNGIDDDGNGYIDDWRGWDFANDDNDPRDDHDHGTHVAGTIGASGNNGVGVAGVNWEVSMVGLKFLSAAGGGSLDDAVEAIEYATSLGVTMTSNSWGGGGASPTMLTAIEAARDAGILFVAAAGNDGRNNDGNPHYPSSYDVDNVISVAATDSSDQLAAFSNYGIQSAHVAAPGVDILSTIRRDGFKSFSGTSMATPHVAGVAALIKARYPELGYEKIKMRLMNTADRIESLTAKTITGGRLNAFNSLEDDSIAPGKIESASVSEVGIATFTVSWSPTGDDGDEGKASRYSARISAEPITTEEEWQAAIDSNLQIVPESIDSDTLQGLVSGLSFGAEGFVTMRAVDNVGNVGELGSSIEFKLIPVTATIENTADSMETVTADDEWAVDFHEEGDGGSFHESPEGRYENSMNSSLYLPEFVTNQGWAALEFSNWYETEKKYDYGQVEIFDETSGEWVSLLKVTGFSEVWKTERIDLSQYLEAGSTVKIRFRFTSDSSVTREGWYLDNIKIYTTAE